MTYLFLPLKHALLLQTFQLSFLKIRKGFLLEICSYMGFLFLVLLGFPFVMQLFLSLVNQHMLGLYLLILLPTNKVAQNNLRRSTLCAIYIQTTRYPLLFLQHIFFSLSLDWCHQSVNLRGLQIPPPDRSLSI